METNNLTAPIAVEKDRNTLTIELMTRMKPVSYTHLGFQHHALQVGTGIRFGQVHGHGFTGADAGYETAVLVFVTAVSYTHLWTVGGMKDTARMPDGH